VLTAQDGDKHTTLRNAAIKLASLIAHGLSEQHITDGLKDAAERNGCDIGYAHKTIADGIAYGKLHPREIPDRQPAQATEQTNTETGELPVPSALVMRGLAALGYSFRLNECDNVIEVNGKHLDDILEAEITTHAWDANVKPKGLIKPAYMTDAAQHAYHPVKDYLTGLQWDGADHITALSTHLHSDDTPIVYDDGTRARLCAVYLKRWLVGAVAKALDRKQNVMLVLAGPQNIGKSALAKWLCSGIPDRFIEGPIRVEDKDSSVRLMSRFIWEVSELDATTRRSDVSALKDFITRDEVTVRKAYGRHDTIKPALASMIGTVNECAGFLSDESGNRRFMVTSITSIDWGYTKIDINQLWAQAVALYRAGEPWRLTPRESKEQAERNQSYDVESALDGWLPKWFDLAAGPTELMTSADIIDHLRAKEIRLNGNERAQAMEISRILARHKVEKVRTNSWRGYRGIAPRDNPVTTYSTEVVTENSAPQSQNDNVTTCDNLKPNEDKSSVEDTPTLACAKSEKSASMKAVVTGCHVVTNAAASGKSGDNLPREVVTSGTSEVVTPAFKPIPRRPMNVNERLALQQQEAELAAIGEADEDLF
jgi:predicted P-loop ATPase